MIAFVLLIVFSLFIFKNSLYFTIILLLISIIRLSFIVLNSFLISLTGFIIVIVYVGAMIILIGYICAVRPNLNLEPNYSNLGLFLLLFLSFIILNKFNYQQFSSRSSTLVEYFYSFQGIFIFITLVFILFLTLLIVTSQYSLPQGPLRSLN